jgi:hypothetical protein
VFFFYRIRIVLFFTRFHTFYSQTLVARNYHPLFLLFTYIAFIFNEISLLFHLFILNLTCSYPYSYNLMLTTTYVCRPYIYNNMDTTKELRLGKKPHVEYYLSIKRMRSFLEFNCVFFTASG